MVSVRLRKSAWLAVILFIPVGLLGIGLMNYPMGYSALTSLGAFLALPMVVVDWVLDTAQRKSASEAVLWGYFVAAQYLWTCALLFVADFVLAGFRASRSEAGAPIKR